MRLHYSRCHISGAISLRWPCDQWDPSNYKSLWSTNRAWAAYGLRKFPTVQNVTVCLSPHPPVRVSVICQKETRGPWCRHQSPQPEPEVHRHIHVTAAIDPLIAGLLIIRWRLGNNKIETNQAFGPKNHIWSQIYLLLTDKAVVLIFQLDQLPFQGNKCLIFFRENFFSF